MASAACCFSEEQFRNLCAELRPPGVGGARWELLVRSMGVSIYWQLNQPTGHYKAIGVLDDFPPDLLADVSMDFNYRKEWDEFVKELYERECSRETVVYWEVESPSPKFNRDVSFPERHHYSAFKKIHVILAQSTSMPQFSEKLCVIQVRQFKQRLAIQSNGKRGSKVFMYYLDNLDCPVPNWLFKWAAKVRSQEAGGEVCLTNVDLICGAVSLKRCTVLGFMMLFYEATLLSDYG
uniref:Phosphatidylcholine transfer protein n=1 Tax=Monodon monoceros TaxID=40151 RepID=A0A8C6BZ07_MONMO